MFIQYRQQGIIALLAFVGASAWPMASLAATCPTGTTQKIIGGTYTCIKVQTNGVDALIQAETLNSNDTFTPSAFPANFSSFSLAVKPTSPFACGGIEDEDCDDMKEAESHEQTQITTSTPTIVAASILPPPPPSGIASCKNGTGVYTLVTIPGNKIVSLFKSSSPGIPSGSGPVLVKSSAPVTDPILVEACGSSVPVDFVPCNMKLKVSAKNSANNRNVNGTLGCLLPATQCFTTAYPAPVGISAKPLGVGDFGMIGLDLFNNHLGDDEVGDDTDDTVHNHVLPLEYNCL